MPDIIDSFRSSTWGWLRGTLLGWGTLLLCLVGVGLIIILVVWVRNLMVTYDLTEERLILRRGIFVKSVDEIELYRVKDVRRNTRYQRPSVCACQTWTISWMNNPCRSSGVSQKSSQ